MKKVLLIIAIVATFVGSIDAQETMHNIFSRERVSLNGVWDILPDPMGVGTNKKWWIERDPQQTPLAEVYYGDWYKLEVPGDWNHQYPEFLYYQGNIWYKRDFAATTQEGERYFLHFGAVAQHCDVYLNEEKIGSHRGGYTPFQIEVTGKLLQNNRLVVRVDNLLTTKTIPGKFTDWCNYGGITRSVDLVTVPSNYIIDYRVGLADNRRDMLQVEVQLDGEDIANKEITVAIAEEGLELKLKTNNQGVAKATKRCDVTLWECNNPHLYEITIATKEEVVEDQIGFRTIEVRGEKIYLNGEPIFLRGVNMHEEISADIRRAYSVGDATYLIQEVKALNCNFLRFAHYPQSEYIVREAERNGILLWEEIPTWQAIDFDDPEVCNYASEMMVEMIERDKNRCCIIFWSVANETSMTDARCKFLGELADMTRRIDPTRLVTSALDKAKAVEDGGRYYMELNDPLIKHLDVVGLNKYMGWYELYPCDADELNWRIATGKPVIMTEFGSEAIFGNSEGDSSNKNMWTESYMEQNYIDNLSSFENCPNLVGIAPWALFDFRSPSRPQGKFQKGWNRKGLIDPMGGKKRAWYVIKDYYDQM